MSSKNNFLKFILLVGDVCLMYGTLILALALRYGDFSFWPGPQTKIFIYNFSFIFIFWVLFLYVLDFYEIPSLRNVFSFFKNLLIFSFLAGVLAVIYFYLRPNVLIAPKTILILQIGLFAAFLFVWRHIFSRILKSKHFKEKVIIVGFPEQAKELSPTLVEQNGYEIIGICGPKEIVKKENVKYIHFVDFYELLFKKVPIDLIDEDWLFKNLSYQEKRIEDILKRGFDILFSFFGLFILVILFPFIALAIKIDSSGPIFYSQKRVGKAGKVFTLYKFRSLKKSDEQNEEPWREKDPSQITRVGRILRQTHLDEILQFWSILKGDLSFVGPRPEWVKLAEEFEKEIPFYSLRYLIKPGFTGWAQLNFPASTSVEETREKFKYDLYYIKNRNFFMDLGIILKTIRIIFK